MFDKFLSKVGIGAAKVDTVLTNPEVMRGEYLTGEIRMTGGKSAQKINQVYLELYTHYNSLSESSYGDVHESRSSFVLHRLNIAEAFTLEAGEEAVWDFEIEVPLYTPITMEAENVWLKTGLDVSWAWDPKDNDAVCVIADPASEQILAAAESLGFEHIDLSGQCHEMPNPYGAPFIQEFVFEGRGPLAKRVEFLNMLLAADEDQAEVLMVVDQRNRGIGGWMADAMGHDKHELKFELGHDQAFSPEDLEGIILEALG
jgi:sporulation-control protein